MVRARRLVLAVLATALLYGGAAEVPTSEDPTIKDWSDAKVLEHLKDDYAAEDRDAAARELLRRWNQSRLLRFCKEDWQTARKILHAGPWPEGGADIEAFVLARTGATDSERAELAGLLAETRGVPDAAGYSTGDIGRLARDAWFSKWFGRQVPKTVFFVGVVDFIAKRPWCRERLYADDLRWCETWGLWTDSTGATQHGWRLTEYRSVVGLLAGDPVDQEHVAGNQFLTVLQAAIKSGANEADVPMACQDAHGLRDLLASWIDLDNLGKITYAHLVAILCDRPDWIPAIERRLASCEYVSMDFIRDPRNGNVLRAVEKVTRQDRRSPLIAMLAEAAQGHTETVKTMLRAYWRREWSGYETSTFSKNLWFRHPWATRIFLDKPFSAWYESEDRRLDGEPDVEFLKSEWK